MAQRLAHPRARGPGARPPAPREGPGAMGARQAPRRRRPCRVSALQTGSRNMSHFQDPSLFPLCRIFKQ